MLEIFCIIKSYFHQTENTHLKSGSHAYSAPSLIKQKAELLGKCNILFVKSMKE